MKDLNFRNQSGSINVTYRTDLINASAQNFTVMTISGLSSQDPTNSFREKKMVDAFKKLPNNLQAFINFGTQYELQLTIADSNGANLQILTRMFDDTSDSES